MSFVYFAYGSNMLSSRLFARCTSAQVIGPGIARHRDIEFSKKSIDGSGKATLISKSEAIHTPGVLFEIDEKDLDELDRFEGAGNGYDRLDDFCVETKDGVLKATTYLASQRHSLLVPYDWYLGPVPLSCRPKCSFKPLFFRMRRGFSSPVLSGGDADYKSH